MALPPANLAKLTEVLRVLGHEMRLNLLLALNQHGESAVGELETLTQIGQPALSQQLAILRKAELVHTRRAAKQIYYRIAEPQFASLAGFLATFAVNGKAPSGGLPQTRNLR
ncbi:MAG: metalloregulator ArsR/SmtB family transcription factor, partial [Sphingorhabdus sp.]